MGKIASVNLIPALKDNYVFAITIPMEENILVIDPGDAGPVIRWCDETNHRVENIFCTHHHHDHVGGVVELKSKYRSAVWTGDADKTRISGADFGLADGANLSWRGLSGEAIFIPGHTLGHTALYFREEGWLFCGDTLFVLGCGRLFEGTARQLQGSLQRLASLPPDTLIFSGHEYGENNARFALSVNPENLALLARSEALFEKRRRGLSSVPSRLSEELATNPFLRPFDPAIQVHLGFSPPANEEDVFAELRRRKDSF